MANFDTFYINGRTLSDATAVFTDAAMTTLAPQNLYSDGNVIRFQSAALTNDIALFSDQSENCNACTTDCNSAVSFSQSYQTSASMQGSVNFGTESGAIKVTIKGVGLRPIGVDLQLGGNRYNYFSSNNFQATPQRYNTPNYLLEKSYFWSLNGVGACGNWTNGTADLDILNYNPNSGVWEDTGNDILNQSLANKLTNGFPPIPPTSVGSVAGNLITYIPKNSNASENLDVIFETPCGAIESSNSAGRGSAIITGPILSVECPVVLSSFASSIALGSHSIACQGGPAINVPRYIGPVRSTSAGILALGDFLFDSPSAAAFTANGFYRTNGSSLNGVSTSFGSFKVENGVVTEIQSC